MYIAGYIPFKGIYPVDLEILRVGMIDLKYLDILVVIPERKGVSPRSAYHVLTLAALCKSFQSCLGELLSCYGYRRKLCLYEVPEFISITVYISAEYEPSRAVIAFSAHKIVCKVIVCYLIPYEV